MVAVERKTQGVKGPLAKYKASIIQSVMDTQIPVWEI